MGRIVMARCSAFSGGRGQSSQAAETLAASARPGGNCQTELQEVAGKLDEDEAGDGGITRALGDFHFATSDSQSCNTTMAELSPGVIEGITKRRPSAETSKETTE